MVVYKKDIEDSRVANDTYLNAYIPQVAAWYDPVNKEVLELTVDTGWNQITQARLYDWDWNPINSLSWAINIHNADIHNTVISESFLQATWVSTTIATTQSALDTSITVVDGSWFTVWNTLTIVEWTNKMDDHFEVIAKPSVNVITLDSPLDFALTSSAVVAKQLHDMNITGSLLSNQIYKISPPSDKVWHIVRIIFSITDSTAMDDGLFWWLTALANWVLVRQLNNGVYKTIAKWKTNWDFGDSMYDINYSLKAPSWEYWLTGRWTFWNFWTVIKLDWATNDELQIVIQDTLTGLNSFHFTWQWHLESI